ncbi:DUF4145 domain-containing protein [Streptomyces sp. NPDC001616]|uniref:DUF4145 domain-containing protein n=1 Tax=unclassified Streptomyces TaxID=2593676 RepID=UPI0023B11A28|nr:DUF4145 domain-containing protein [Streptomyces sp. KA12]
MSARSGTDVLITCPHCERPALAQVVGEAAGRDEDGSPPYLLELARCSKCSRPFLAVEEDYGDGWDGEPGVLWPEQQRPLSLHVPEDLRRVHAEGRRCFSAKAYTATAVMVRRTLEAVCVDQGMVNDASGRPKPLFKMLEEMRDQGKIDGRLFEWAHELRSLGNQGAHYTTVSVTREDAADGLALAEALLDYLYVLHAQFNTFKQRRQAAQEKRNAGKVPSPSTEPTTQQKV